MKNSTIRITTPGEVFSGKRNIGKMCVKGSIPYELHEIDKVGLNQ
jgi:hypothetical protein